MRVEGRLKNIQDVKNSAEYPLQSLCPAWSVLSPDYIAGSNCCFDFADFISEVLISISTTFSAV